MLPEHLRVLVENERQKTPDIHAFEIGALHEWRDGQPVQTEVLGLVLAGRDRPVAHDLEPGQVDVALAKGLLERLTERLTWNRLTYEPLTPRAGVEHPGRTAAVVAVSATGDSTIVGRVGELHPRLLEAYGVHAEHVVFAEIRLEAYERLVPDRLRVGRLEHLPGVERDIAVVVPEETPAGQVEAIIREHGGLGAARRDALRSVPRNAARRGREEPGVPPSFRVRRRRAGRRSGRPCCGAVGYSVVRATWRTPALLIALPP